MAATVMNSRKLSKHIMVVLAVLMIGGLIVAFMFKYGIKGDHPSHATAEKMAATVAAQVGNDTPEAESAAKAEIVAAASAAKEKWEIQQAGQKTRETPPEGQGYPNDGLPFETGEVTSQQLDRYQAAKDALSRLFEQAKNKFIPEQLPAAYDQGGISAAEIAPASNKQTAAPVVPGKAAEQQGDGVSASMEAPKDQSEAPSEASQTNGEASGAATPPAPTMPTLGMAETGTGNLADRSESELIQSMMHGRASQQPGDPNEQWQEKQEKLASSASTSPLQIAKPPTSPVLQEGAVIPLVLLTALNNTLPGHVSARVISNVYDSIAGEVLAIPAGSRLEGNYNQSTVFGQNRMMFGFSRIILPSGASIRIAAWTGGDAQGRSGVAGDLDNHLLQQFGTGILLGALAWVLQPSGTQNGVTVNTAGGNFSSFNTAAGQITADTATGILSKYQNLKPELNVAAGTRCTLIVLQDIALPDMAKNEKVTN